MLKNHGNNYQFNIDKFYRNYLKGPRIFNNREALEPSYIPVMLPHRDYQIKDIAEKTACALLGDSPPSFLCYGQTGTGKTATIRYVSQKLAQQSSEIKPWWIYINCNVVSTPYRILAHIYNTISREEKIPPTGLPKDIIFKKLLGLLDSKVRNSICFLVLDEIDILVDKKGGNEILYDLTRLNENLDQCKSSLIGISNKLKFRNNLDPRILSSLGEEHLVFPSYDASELRDILSERAKIAFCEAVLKEDVIPLCAAIAAKEHGDARKALQLLRKAGELAERAQSKIVTSEYVEKAQNDLEKDYIIEFIKGIPLQAQLVLTSIYLLSKFSPEHIIISGDIYDVHSEIRSLIPGVRQLTKRRISDYINELALAGIITAEVRSMGHYGRTKIIKLDIEIAIVEKVLSEIEKIRGILNHKPVILQTNKVKLKNNIFKKLI
ncbi:MAG: Cdc6/Cdc18 family protein [Promethearchaeota archaeon]